MDVGTAKRPPALRRVRYHCIDLVDPDHPYSAALYQRDARTALADIAGRGLVPVVTGGTGLYVRAALEEMEFPSGGKDSPLRSEMEHLAESLGSHGLHRLLEMRDPASAALIHPNNVRRVVRALEMLGGGGPSYADQSSHFRERRQAVPAVYVGLTMERDVLYARIDSRVDEMLSAGLLQEVASLIADGYGEALRSSQAIGYKELIPVLEQGADLQKAVEAVKQATRRYAKRQMTWFRADPRIEWLDVTRMSPKAATAAARALVESRSTG
jgi:tRNA dimethylallyltransferase